MKTLLVKTLLVKTLPVKTLARLVLAIAVVMAAAFASAQSDTIPPGNYELDKAHASLLFRVDHLGFSMYTARFTRFDADLYFDPKNLASARLDAVVDARSVETDFPTPEVLNFNETLQNETWLNTAKYPEMRYKSERIEVVDENKLRVHGNLTLRGVSAPVVLDVTFNGGYEGHTMDPRARVGFSAVGRLNRSDFGISYGIPEPGSKMGVSDAVEIIIEVEFSGPPYES